MMIKQYDLQGVTQMHYEEYREAAERVMQSGWFLLGEETKRFEEAYAQYIGTGHCIAVGNGLDALRLMLRGYKELGRLKEGDEVIVPANTYIATILAITDNGLHPVLAEPTLQSLTIDTSNLESLLTARTRAVLTVHLYGRLAYDEQLKTFCRANDLLLMEDCAQSQGCQYQGTKTGALGDAAAHSFYPAKNIGAMGDAGAVTTSDEALARVVRTLANYGSSRKYVFEYQGWNSRMSEIDAAILQIKLRYLDEDNAHRQRVAAYYYDYISNPAIQLPQRLPAANNVYHQFPVFSNHRDALQTYLSECGIQTIIHYPIPPHQQHCYAAWNTLHLPLTERIASTELSLPISPILTEHDAAAVCTALNQFT